MTPNDVSRLPALWPADYEPDSSSVHSPETKSPDSQKTNDWGYVVTSDDPAVTFRHSGWAGTRKLIRQAMADDWTSPRRLSRFDLCGSEPWLAVNPDNPDEFAVLTNHCRSRWCVPCSRERAARIMGNLRCKLNEGSVRFLTLTLKHSDTPLSNQIDRIYACFRHLRRAPFWQAKVQGGAAVLELTHGWKDDLWHVHLHCLLQGGYVRHADLKAEWHRITGDSYIVDIRPVGSPEHAARYVTKYITKPVPNTVIRKPEPLREMLSACSHRRLVLTWGTWRGLKLSAPLSTVAWRTVCPLEDLYNRRDAGDLDAFNTILRLERLIPEARTLAGRGPPLTPFDALPTEA